MEINDIYDKGLIISKTDEFGLESFEKGTNIIKDLCNSDSLILVIVLDHTTTGLHGTNGCGV